MGLDGKKSRFRNLFVKLSFKRHAEIKLGDLATWRIIAVSKWLVSPIYKTWKAHLEGVP